MIELNKRVAELLGLKYVGQGRCIVSHGEYIDLPDYCNNWNDLMPLVFEYGISVEFSRGDFQSAYIDDCDGFPYIQSEADPPQRAIIECLIKLLEEKNQ